MVSLIVRFVICAAGLWVASKLLGGVTFASTESLLIAAVVLGLANAILRPILQIIALPITIMTLGVFAFIVNGAVVALVDKLLDGFSTRSFWDDIWIAVIVGIVGWAVNLFGEKKEQAPRHSS